MKFTPANQWRRGGPELRELTLPSGNIVQIRKLQPIDFISTGLLPAGLMDISKNEDRAEAMKSHIAEGFKEDPDAIVNAMIRGYVYAPEIVLDREPQGESQIHITWLSDEDRLAILNAGNEFSGFTQEALADANSFRLQ